MKSIHITDYVYIDLDFRAIFDTDDKGRIYSIYKHDDLIIVEYTKYSDDSFKRCQDESISCDKRCMQIMKS